MTKGDLGLDCPVQIVSLLGGTDRNKVRSHKQAFIWMSFDQIVALLSNTDLDEVCSHERAIIKLSFVFDLEKLS